MSDTVGNVDGWMVAREIPDGWIMVAFSMGKSSNSMGRNGSFGDGCK
jgi:hypothetical protein